MNGTSSSSPLINGGEGGIRLVDLNDPSWWEPFCLVHLNESDGGGKDDQNYKDLTRIHNEASALLFDEKLPKEEYFQICCLMWIIQQQQQQQQQQQEDGGAVSNTTRQLWRHIKSSYLEGRRQEKSMVQWILPDLVTAATTTTTITANDSSSNGNDKNVRLLDLIEDKMKVEYGATTEEKGDSANNSDSEGSEGGEKEDAPTQKVYTACILEFFKMLYDAAESPTTTHIAGDNNNITNDATAAATSGRPFKRRRTFYNGSSSAATNLLSGRYKLPAVYLLTSVLVKQQQLQQQQRQQREGQTTTSNVDGGGDDNDISQTSSPSSSLLSWTSIRTAAHIIAGIFKTLTEQDIQVGLALVGLQYLQTQQQPQQGQEEEPSSSSLSSTTSAAIEGLTVPNLINEYFANTSSYGLSILPSLQEALSIGPYTIRATVCNQLLDRILDESNDDEQVCLKCLDMDDPKRCISRLQSLHQPKTNKRGFITGQNPLVPEEVSSPTYPIMTHLKVLLVANEDRRAANLAHEIDKCSSFTSEQKDEAWSYIWQFLLDNGQVFLDNNVQTPGYTEKRDFLYNAIASRASKGARKVMMDFYEELSNSVSKSDQATPAEKYYVVLACQQTTLRLLLKACGLERRTIQHFLDQTQWPTPLPPYNPSQRQLDEWAASFLQQSNSLPETLIDKDTNDIDLSRLLYRDATTPGSVPVVEPDMLAADDDELPSMAEDVDKEPPVTAGRLDEPLMRDSVDDFATYSAQAEVEGTYELEDGTRVPSDAVRLETDQDRRDEGGIEEGETDYFEIQNAEVEQQQDAARPHDDEEYLDDDMQGDNEEEGEEEEEDDDDEVDIFDDEDDDQKEEDEVDAYDDDGEGDYETSGGPFFGEEDDAIDYDDNGVGIDDNEYSDQDVDDGDNDDNSSSEDNGEQNYVGGEEPEAVFIGSEDDGGSSNEVVLQPIDSDAETDQEEDVESSSQRPGAGKGPLPFMSSAKPGSSLSDEVAGRNEPPVVKGESNLATSKTEIPPEPAKKSDAIYEGEADEQAKAVQATTSYPSHPKLTEQKSNATDGAMQDQSFSKKEGEGGNDDDDDIAESDIGTDDEQEHMSEEANKAETTPLAGEKFGSTTDEEDYNYRSRANQAAEEDRRADALRAHVQRHKHVGYASQVEDGYEPEDTHGYTEEEASEAIHTEDELEERTKVKAQQRSAQSGSTEQATAQTVSAVEPASNDMPHSSDDMDMADEHTEHEEVDLGAESSELEDVPDAGGPPEVQYTTLAVAPSSKSAPSDRDPTSLVDFASSAQRQHDWSRSRRKSKSTPMAVSAPQPGEHPDHPAAYSFEADADDEKDQTEASQNIETEEETGNPESVENFDDGDNEDSMEEALPGAEYTKLSEDLAEDSKLQPVDESDNINRSEEVAEDSKPEPQEKGHDLEQSEELAQESKPENADEGHDVEPVEKSVLSSASNVLTYNNEAVMPSKDDEQSSPPDANSLPADDIETEIQPAGTSIETEEAVTNSYAAENHSNDQQQDKLEDESEMHMEVDNAIQDPTQSNDSANESAEAAIMEIAEDNLQPTEDTVDETEDPVTKDEEDVKESNDPPVNSKPHDEQSKEEEIEETKEENRTKTSPLSPGKTPKRKGASGESVATKDTHDSGRSSHQSRAVKNLSDFNSPPQKKNKSPEKDDAVPSSIDVGRKRKTRSAASGSARSGYDDDGDDASTIASTLTTPRRKRSSRRAKDDSGSPVEEVEVGHSDVKDLGEIEEEGDPRDNDNNDEKESQSVGTRRSKRGRKAKYPEDAENIHSTASTGTRTRASRSRRGQKGSEETDGEKDSDVNASADVANEESKKNKPLGKPPRAPGRQTREKKPSNDTFEDAEEDVVEGAGNASSTRKGTRSKRNAASKNAENEAEAGDNESAVSSLASRTTRRTRTSKNQALDDDVPATRSSKRSRKNTDVSNEPSKAVATTTRRRTTRKKEDPGGDTGDEDETVESGATTRSRRSRTGTQGQSKSDQTTDAEESISAAPKKRTTRGGKKPPEEMAENRDEDESKAAPAPKRATRGRKKKAEDEEESEAPAPATKRPTRGPSKKTDKEPPEEKDEEAVAAPAPKRTTRGRGKKASKEPPAEKDEESVAASVSTRRSTRGRKKEAEQPPEEKDEESVAASVSTRRSTRSRKAKTTDDEE
eukprot:CAMPEP_0113444008 /NCGR_PEP_ID=MMETSP0014_2-20120614/2444_1 /TAXON_ID=2857 /ORGANISM="Nitzschia sp." /LENGTH=2161 /DNA_ID=CAMNT_0000335005 /DNA_START=252 /DNA_END=6734 /DNA_ORIENTATION=- /assembly_acc=CAM_ASM_000159